MSGVLPVVDSRDQQETPPTPTALPIGPRSVLPAGRKSLARRDKGGKLPLAPKPESTALPTPAAQASATLTPALADAGPWAEPKELPPVPSNKRQLVRPYTRTGGRTRAGYRLELETLLTTSMGRDRDIQTLRDDYRTICEMCRMPHSTAEIAARLGLPLGAARVLIGDVVGAALLFVHETAQEGPSMDLLQRVAAGLKRL